LGGFNLDGKTLDEVGRKKNNYKSGFEFVCVYNKKYVYLICLYFVYTQKK